MQRQNKPCPYQKHHQKKTGNQSPQRAPSQAKQLRAEPKKMIPDQAIQPGMTGTELAEKKLDLWIQ